MKNRFWFVEVDKRITKDDLMNMTLQINPNARCEQESGGYHFLFSPSIAHRLQVSSKNDVIGSIEGIGRISRQIIEEDKAEPEKSQSPKRKKTKLIRKAAQTKSS